MVCGCGRQIGALLDYTYKKISLDSTHFPNHAQILPFELPVVYLVTQDGIWGSGSDDVGLIQSTKAPKTRVCIQRYLACEKISPPRTLQYDSAQGPMVVLG